MAAAAGVGAGVAAGVGAGVGAGAGATLRSPRTWRAGCGRNAAPEPILPLLLLRSHPLIPGKYTPRLCHILPSENTSFGEIHWVLFALDSILNNQLTSWHRFGSV